MAEKKIVRFKMSDGGDENVRVSFHINFSTYTKWHYHDFWEIQLMLEGDCINVLNGESISLKEMETQIIRPDDLHYCRKIEKDEHKLLNLEIKRSFFENLLEEFSPPFKKYILEMQGQIPKIKCSFSVFEKIWKLVQLASRYPDIVAEERQYLSKEIAVTILFEFMNAFYADKINKQPDLSFYNNLYRLMDCPENISKKLNEICALVPCSVEMAIRNFKKEGKDTPNKVFRRIKMEYACSLLETTDYTILTICEMVGYSNIGFFNKLFKEFYGESPKMHRKKYRVQK